MGISVVDIAPSDGSHLEAGSVTTTVFFSLLIYSRSITHRRNKKVMSIGKVIMDHTLDILDH
jgi:hypothetical protein